jgi:tetratricopeptide (TPR) repeat protein
MDKTILVNFAGAEDLGLDASLRSCQAAMSESAAVAGIDEIIPWTRQRLLATSFYQANRAILDLPRGAGYWLWKPLIILDALEHASRGDVVIYWDVGRCTPNRFTRSISPLVRWCRQHDGILPGVPILPQGQWTKRDCFCFMNCDAPRFWNAVQIQATFSLWCGSRAIEFVEEWLTWCRDPRCITDAHNVSGLPNLPGFVEHRHDQSILTNLCVKRNIRALDPLPRLRRGRWTKDVNIFSEALAPGEDPAPASTNSLRAETEEIAHARKLLQAGDLVAAEQACRDVLTGSGLNADAVHLLGVIFARTGRVSQAIELLERSARLPGADVAAIHLSLAEFLAPTPDAEIACRQALATNPMILSGWLLLARILVQQGRGQEADIALQKARRLDPDGTVATSRPSSAPPPAGTV